MSGALRDARLQAFLASLRRGEVLSGTVAAIERFGVFVALDDGPVHPVLPGVGFITIPELSWRRFDEASEVVQVGQRISGTFLGLDRWNLGARLSLRAAQPDPFAAFADATAVGRIMWGQVTEVLPFGVFVRVADGIEGLVRVADPVPTAVAAGSQVVRAGDRMQVVVTGIDRERRRLNLSRRQAVTGLR
jgi:small subunit ribosomal protein S1